MLRLASHIPLLVELCLRVRKLLLARERERGRKVESNFSKSATNTKIGRNSVTVRYVFGGNLRGLFVMSNALIFFLVVRCNFETGVGDLILETKSLMRQKLPKHNTLPWGYLTQSTSSMESTYISNQFYDLISIL